MGFIIGGSRSKLKASENAVSCQTLILATIRHSDMKYPAKGRRVSEKHFEARTEAAGYLEVGITAHRPTQLAPNRCGLVTCCSCALSATGLLALGASLSPQYKPMEVKKLDAAASGPQGLSADLERVVERIDASFRQDWKARGLRPTPRADQLTIARRLSLALAGTIPSLEEIRRFEATPEDARLNAWVSTLLADPRHHDYFAERLARAYVGVRNGFIVYRRHRFTAWLAEQIRDQRPYDALVRELISSSGLPTSEPAINFLAVTLRPDDQLYHVNEKEMAARVSRAFLGVRIDCAECHNHPFEPWKQSDFQGLAAWFRAATRKFGGIGDVNGKFEVEDRVTGKMLTVEPRVPFQNELLPAKGSDRQRLAAWVTDPHNKRFSRAICQSHLGADVRPRSGRTDRRRSLRAEDSTGTRDPGGRLRRARLQPAAVDHDHLHQRSLPARQPQRSRAARG